VVVERQQRERDLREQAEANKSFKSAGSSAAASAGAEPVQRKGSHARSGSLSGGGGGGQQEGAPPVSAGAGAQQPPLQGGRWR